MPDTDPTHAMGYAFEKHVLGLLKKEFDVVRWMQDGASTKEEIDFSPDIVVKNKKTGAVAGIECKFRSTHFKGRISWAKEYQLKKYERFKDKAGCPLFIVIGLGGTPEKPGYMYCVPLWQAAHRSLDADSLKRYRRNPQRPFTWSAGRLT